MNAPEAVGRALDVDATPEDLARVVSGLDSDRATFLNALEALNKRDANAILYNAIDGGPAGEGLIEALAACGAGTVTDALVRRFGALAREPRTLPALVRGLQRAGCEEALSGAVTEWVEGHFTAEKLAEWDAEDRGHEHGAGFHRNAEELARTVASLGPGALRQAALEAVERGASRLGRAEGEMLAGFVRDAVDGRLDGNG